MSSIHYKLRSTLEYKTLQFDGLHICGSDLVKEICAKENIKSELFDLRLQNAHTEKNYEAEDLIPRNSSILVQRVPRSDAGKVQKVQSGVNSGMINQADTSTVSSILASSHIATEEFEQMNEEDRLNHVRDVSTRAYDSSNYRKKTGGIMSGPPPPTYTCNRCYQPGHWYKNCPMLNTKRTTGIPSQELMETTQDDPLAMLHPSGKYVVPIMHWKARQEQLMRKQALEESGGGDRVVPPELTCPICHHLIKEAVLTTCCGNSFCADCIGQRIFETEDKKCPGKGCNQQQVSVEALISNKSLRQAAEAWLAAAGGSASVQLASLPASATPEQQPEQIRIRIGLNPIKPAVPSAQPSGVSPNSTVVAAATVAPTATVASAPAVSTAVPVQQMPTSLPMATLPAVVPTVNMAMPLVPGVPPPQIARPIQAPDVAPPGVVPGSAPLQVSGVPGLNVHLPPPALPMTQIPGVGMHQPMISQFAVPPPMYTMQQQPIQQVYGGNSFDAWDEFLRKKDAGRKDYRDRDRTRDRDVQRRRRKSRSRTVSSSSDEDRRKARRKERDENRYRRKGEKSHRDYEKESRDKHHNEARRSDMPSLMDTHIPAPPHLRGKKDITKDKGRERDNKQRSNSSRDVARRDRSSATRDDEKRRERRDKEKKSRDEKRPGNIREEDDEAAIDGALAEYEKLKETSSKSDEAVPKEEPAVVDDLDFDEDHEDEEEKETSATPEAEERLVETDQRKSDDDKVIESSEAEVAEVVPKFEDRDTSEEPLQQIQESSANEDGDDKEKAKKEKKHKKHKKNKKHRKHSGDEEEDDSKKKKHKKHKKEKKAKKEKERHKDDEKEDGNDEDKKHKKKKERKRSHGSESDSRHDEPEVKRERKEKEREEQKDRDRVKEKDRRRSGENEKEKDRERESARAKEQQVEKKESRDVERAREKERDRERDREKGREREKERDRPREKERDRKVESRPGRDRKESERDRGRREGDKSTDVEADEKERSLKAENSGRMSARDVFPSQSSLRKQKQLKITLHCK